MPRASSATLAVQLKNKKGWDDALDVWGVHGVGGVVGTILLGVFASQSVNSGAPQGLIYGGTGFFVKQVVAVVGASLYAFLFTYIMLFVINKITKVRVSEEEELKGLDAALHEEVAYQEGVL